MLKLLAVSCLAFGLAGIVGSAIYADESQPQPAIGQGWKMGVWKMGQLSEDQQAAIEARQQAMEAVMAAIENGDYNAWLEAVENVNLGVKFTELITEENFSKFVEMHQLMQEAQEIREELGIGGWGRMGFGGQRPGKGPCLYFSPEPESGPSE